jgi:hypothetical protein
MSRIDDHAAGVRAGDEVLERLRGVVEMPGDWSQLLKDFVPPPAISISNC